MTEESAGMQEGIETRLLDLVFLFTQRVAFDDIFPVALSLFLVFVFIRDHVQTNRVHLNNLDLNLALGAAEDFAFLYFVFINVDLDGTFRTADHSRTSNQG